MTYQPHGSRRRRAATLEEGRGDTHQHKHQRVAELRQLGGGGLQIPGFLMPPLRGKRVRYCTSQSFIGKKVKSGIKR